MKKFLFTLAAMFVAGTAFAHCYLYVDNEEIDLASKVGAGEIEIPVKAHFDYRVSAWDVEFEYPQGVTPTFIESGSDMVVPGFNARGKATTFTATLYGAYEPWAHVIATLGEAAYWQDPNGENPSAWVSFGVAKWEAGDYDEMLLLYVEVDETYDGGDIVVWTTPSSGADARGGACKDSEDEGVRQTVPEDVPQTIDFVATATVGENNGLVVPVSYTANDPDAVVTVYVNGEEVEVEFVEGQGTVTLPAYDTDYTVAITVAPNPEGNYVGEAASDSKDFNVPTPTVPFQATATVGTNNGLVVPVSYTANDPNAVVTVTVNGTAVNVEFVNGEGTVTLPAYDTDYTVAITVAPNPEGNYEGEAVSDSKDFNVPTPPTPFTATIVMTEPEELVGYDVDILYESNDPAATVTVVVNEADAEVEFVDGVGVLTLGQDPDYGTWVVTVTVAPGRAFVGEPVSLTKTYVKEQQKCQTPTIDVDGLTVTVNVADGETAHLLVNGNEVTLDENNSYTFEEGTEAVTYNLTAYATADKKIQSDNATDQITVPAATIPQTEAPTVTPKYDVDKNYVQVVAEGDGEVTLYIDGVAAENPYEAVRGDKDYWIQAYAVAHVEGQTDGVSQPIWIFVPAYDGTTSIMETVDGKTIAGVRYFNMAGQEMQEANGITIVVTTYTDGTTSAVKVIK